MKIGMVTQWTSPEPLPLFGSLARSLCTDGHQVRIMTTFPNYPHDVAYGHHGTRERLDKWHGTEMLRVRGARRPVKGAISRIGSYVRFAASTLKNRKFLSSSDVIYVYASPMTVAACALMLKFTRGVPFVLHIQDLWPQSVTDSGLIPGKWLNSVIGKMIDFAMTPLYGAAASLVVISPGMKSALVAKGVEEDKISVVLNWDPNQGTSDRTANEAHEHERVNFVYAGNIGVMQDLETLVKAVARVESEDVLHVSIYGSGVHKQNIVRLAQQLGLSNLSIHDRVSSEDMEKVYAASDFQLVTLLDREVFRSTIPSKFQASLSRGIPIVSTVAGDLESICEGYGLGFTASPSDVESLANALVRAASTSREEREAMAKRCREYYAQNLSKEQTTRKIGDILESASRVSP